MRWERKGHVQGQISKSLWEGEGENLPKFSQFLFFSIFAVSFFRVGSNCGIWEGVEDPRPKASPVNVYGRGEGLLANMQAGGPLIMIVDIDMLHIITGTHPEALAF